MDKNCKIVLNKILKTEKPEEYKLYFFDDNLKKEAEKFGFSVDEFSNILHQLEDDRFAKINPRCFYLTQKGVHYHEFLRTKTMKWILSSIIVPIFVSVSCSVITYIIMEKCFQQ